MQKLAFYIWAYKNVRENPIYQIHLRCLKYYHNIFTDTVFYVALEEEGDLYREIVNDIIGCGFDECSVKIIKGVNDYKFGEAKFCYDEVFHDLLSYDGITLFSHTKGLSNVLDEDRNITQDTERIKKIACWVCGMYYSNLSDMTDVTQRLYRDGYITYGAFKVNNNYWHYAGSFYWVNSKKLWNYLNAENKQMPIPADRTYAESVFYLTFPEKERKLMQTFNDVHFNNVPTMYDTPFESIERVFGFKYASFLDFYSKITDGIL